MFGRFPGEEQGEAVKDILRTNNPSKRMADPLEIAKLAVYLASLRARAAAQKGN
jgi:NAD(P)-dependent dehydrogenase (short-subunit alcohol dehydrogenase family)